MKGSAHQDREQKKDADSRPGRGPWTGHVTLGKSQAAHLEQVTCSDSKQGDHISPQTSQEHPKQNSRIGFGFRQTESLMQKAYFQLPKNKRGRLLRH